mgnify:CR=1 FL=1
MMENNPVAWAALVAMVCVSMVAGPVWTLDGERLCSPRLGAYAFEAVAATGGGACSGVCCGGMASASSLACDETPWG